MTNAIRIIRFGKEIHKPSKYTIKRYKITASGIVLSIPEVIILKSYVFFNNFKRFLTRVWYESMHYTISAGEFLAKARAFLLFEKIRVAHAVSLVANHIASTIFILYFLPSNSKHMINKHIDSQYFQFYLIFLFHPSKANL